MLALSKISDQIFFHMEEFIQLVKKTNPSVKVKVIDGHIHMNGDIYLWYLLDKVVLPNNLKINGNLYFGADIIDTLPNGLEVKGLIVFMQSKISKIPPDLKTYSLSLSFTNVKKLPENMNYFKGSLVLSFSKFSELPSTLTVKGNLDIGHTLLKTLPDNLKVGNTLFLSDDKFITDSIGTKTLNLSLHGSEIKTLPPGIKLKGTLDLSDSHIEFLPNDLIIGGDLLLKDCKNIKSLPDGLFIGGILDLEGTNIKSLPEDIVIQNKKTNYQISESSKDDNYEDNLKVLSEFQKRISPESDSKILGRLHRSFVKDYPMNPFAYEELMSYYYLLGKFDKVETIYKRAVRKDIETDTMKYIIGCSYYKKRDFKISFHYAYYLFDNYGYREQSAVLIFNSLYGLLKNNSEDQFMASNKLFKVMKAVEKSCRKELKNSDDIQYYRKLINTMEIDLNDNKKLTKKYKVFKFK